MNLQFLPKRLKNDKMEIRNTLTIKEESISPQNKALLTIRTDDHVRKD